MVIKYPDVSKDFQKLIRTLATSFEREFDYWDDLVMQIYRNVDNPSVGLETYFKTFQWVYLNKPYPTCPDFENDWFFIRDKYVKNIGDTTYRVDKNSLLESPLREYAEDETLPSLVTT